jgi:hypothetical protein
MSQSMRPAGVRTRERVPVLVDVTLRPAHGQARDPMRAILMAKMCIHNWQQGRLG